MNDRHDEEGRAGDPRQEAIETEVRLGALLAARRWSKSTEAQRLKVGRMLTLAKARKRRARMAEKKFAGGRGR